MRETTCKYSGMILRAFDRGTRTLFEVNLAVLRTMRVFVEDVKGGNLYFSFDRRRLHKPTRLLLRRGGSMKLKHTIAAIIVTAALFYALGFIAGQYNGKAALIREAQQQAIDAQPLRFPIGAF